MSTDRRRRASQLLRIGASFATVAVFALLILGKRGSLSASLGRLGHPRWWWIPLAVVLEAASMATFAAMQRRLLGVGGRRVGTRAMMATIFAANALSVTVPLAGPELGAAFTFRRFKKQGADASLAGWALLVGGLVSWSGGVVVLAVGGALSGNVVITAVAILSILLAVALGMAVWAGLGRARVSLLVERPVAWLVGHVSRLLSRPVDNPSGAVTAWIAGVRSLHPSKAEWGRVGSLGLANWLTDIGVLAMSILAIGGPVPWRSLLLIYGLATVIGSLGITPGGIGLVEGTLCLGLASTGIPAALALAAVLLYRLVSFWLVMAAGWVVLLYLRVKRSPLFLSVKGSIAV